MAQSKQTPLHHEEVCGQRCKYQLLERLVISLLGKDLYCDLGSLMCALLLAELASTLSGGVMVLLTLSTPT